MNTFRDRIEGELADVSGYPALAAVQADAILAMPEMEWLRKAGRYYEDTIGGIPEDPTPDAVLEWLGR